MKSLAFGIVLILLIGLAGFFYRNVSERTPSEGTVACTMEAKVCPDGSAVGRTGPSCEFAPCALPNVELANAGIAFALPPGYARSPSLPGADTSGPELAAYEKPGTHSPTTIVVYAFPIPEGKTADDVILSTALFSPSDMHADSMSKFMPVLVNGREFRSAVLERFEGVVESAYYLPRAKDVLRFDVIERGVDWTNPDLEIDKLSGHVELLKMLGTLELR